MDELKAEVAGIARDFTEFQGKLAAAMKTLEGTPEHGAMLELSQALTEAHGEVAKTAGPALDWMDQEQKALQAEIDKTQAELADLKQRLEAARAEAAKPKPKPPPPKPPVVPGEGDPNYGRVLGDELLGLIGHGKDTPEGKPALGSVWELESVDWKAAAVPEVPPPAQAPGEPAKTSSPPARPTPSSLGGMESTDWDGK